MCSLIPIDFKENCFVPCNFILMINFNHLVNRFFSIFLFLLISKTKQNATKKKEERKNLSSSAQKSQKKASIQVLIDQFCEGITTWWEFFSIRNFLNNDWNFSSTFWWKIKIYNFFPSCCSPLAVLLNIHSIATKIRFRKIVSYKVFLSSFSFVFLYSCPSLQFFFCYSSSPFQLWFELCGLFSKEACRHKSIEFDFIKVIDEKESTKKVLKAYMDAIVAT